MFPWANASPWPKRHLDRFSRFCTARVRVSLGMPGACPSSSKSSFPVGTWTPSNRPIWFLGPIQAHNPNGISIGSGVFRVTTVTDRPTDRPTDHATRSETIGRIYAGSTVMRPNNNHNKAVGNIADFTPAPPDDRLTVNNSPVPCICISPIMWNMTLFTKPDVHYCIVVRVGRAIRPLITCTENFVTFGRVLFEICERRDRPTNRHSRRSQCFVPLSGAKQ